MVRRADHTNPTKLMVCPFNYLVKYLDKRKKCVGTEPSALLYVGILVTSTITGHGGSVVSPLASQALGRGSIPSCSTSSPPPPPSPSPPPLSIYLSLFNFCPAK